MNIINFEKHLFEHDSTALNIEDEYIISGKKTVGDYLYGRCHIFAMALHEQLGLAIEALIDEDPLHNTNGKPSLEHVYCIINDDFVIDARGIRSKKEVIEEYGSNANEAVQIPNCIEFLHEWMDAKLLCSPKNKEIKDINNYIKLMQEHNMFAIANNYEDESLINHLVPVLPSQHKKIKIK